MRKFMVLGGMAMVALLGATWFLWQDNIQLKQNNAMLEARVEQLTQKLERDLSMRNQQSAKTAADAIIDSAKTTELNMEQTHDRVDGRTDSRADSRADNSSDPNSIIPSNAHQTLDREYADALLGDQTRWNEFVSGSIEQALQSSKVQASPEAISRVTQALSQMRDASIQLSSQEYNIDSPEYQRLQVEKTLLILNVDQMIRNELNMTTADLMDSLDQGEVDDVGADGS